MTNRTLQQWIAVLKVYLSWRVTWMVVAGYLVALCAVLLPSRSGRSLTPAVQPFNYFAGFARILPADTIRIERLQLSVDATEEALQPDSPFRIPGRLPNLRSLSIFSVVSEKQLIELLEHVHLESLTLSYLGLLTERGWNALERQPLQSLMIESIDPGAAAAARWPVTLRNLWINDDQPMNPNQAPSNLESLLRLPYLETVSVRLSANREDLLQSPDLAALKQLGSLKTLYVESVDRGLIAAVQHELPGTAVRPARYPAGRVTGALNVLAIGAIPLLFLLQALSLQFAPAQFILRPHHRQIHGQFALVLTGCCLAIQGGALVATGCSLLPATALAGATLPVLGLITRVLQKSTGFPGFTHFQFLIPGLMAILLLMPLAMLFDHATLDWFLQGGFPLWAAILIALQAIALVYLVSFFASVCRVVTEKFEGAIPFGGSNTTEVRITGSARNRSLRWDNWFSGAGRRHRLESALSCSRSSPMWQAYLWRAGHGTSTWDSIRFVAIIMSVGACAITPLLWVWWFQFDTAAMLSSLRAGAWLILLQATAACCYIPAVLLHQRSPYLTQHLLASCQRREWIRLIFREMAREFAPAAILLALTVFAYGLSGSQTWGGIEYKVLLGIAGLALAYGLTLLSATLSTTSTTALGFAVVTTTGILSAAFVGPPELSSNSADFLGQLTPEVCWLCTGILALFVILVAYRRWLRWELGA